MIRLKSISQKYFLGALLLPVFLLITGLYGCSKSDKVVLSPLEAQGKTVFAANCIACHNSDPRLPGSVGPDIAGSSLELISARVMHKSYPSGYTPKRSSHLMPELPFLEKDIPALHAYLNSFKRQ